MRYVVLLGLLALAACAEPVQLRNPQTGQTVNCGPYPGGIQATASAIREGQCIEDFKQQGFIRVAH